jgi:hypothetical protein
MDNITLLNYDIKLNHHNKIELHHQDHELTPIYLQELDLPVDVNTRMGKMG